MFKKIAITTIAASALLVSMQASAAGGHHHKRDGGVNKEQREQSVMIQQGIKTCQITPAEARTLKSTQRRIAGLERKFKSNGFSRWEIKTLHAKLHAARVEINRLTKNRSNCRPKYRSNDHRNGPGAHRNRHGANNHGTRNNRGGGSISVTVRNIH